MGCNAAEKNKHDKNKPINKITHKYQYIYIILLTRISNVTSNHQLVLFDRLPLTPTDRSYLNIEVICAGFHEDRSHAIRITAHKID